MEIKTREDFGKLFESLKKTGVGAEIGVQYGYFSSKIAEFYTGKLLCIDLWGDENTYEIAKKALSDESKFKLYRGDSLTLAEFIPNGSLDFAYIDANHHYKEVLADIEAWYPKVRSGGILAGHDYVKYQDIEVIEAVDDWCKKTGYEIKLTSGPEDYFEGTLFASWWIVKK